MFLVLAEYWLLLLFSHAQSSFTYCTTGGGNEKQSPSVMTVDIIDCGEATTGGGAASVFSV